MMVRYGSWSTNFYRMCERDVRLPDGSELGGRRRAVLHDAAVLVVAARIVRRELARAGLFAASDRDITITTLVNLARELTWGCL